MIGKQRSSDDDYAEMVAADRAEVLTDAALRDGYGLSESGQEWERRGFEVVDIDPQQPVLLDLFCGAGGAGVGYALAGFRVIGVDIAPQPNYPFEFIQADAVEYLDKRLRWLATSVTERDPLDGGEPFDAVHASPPCQRFVGWQNIAALRGGQNDHPDLIEPVRQRLERLSVPWVIENIENAPLIKAIRLCGSMFGLGVRRHRVFESNVLLHQPSACQHTGREVGVYGKLDGRRLFTRKDGSEQRNPKDLAEASAAMGIDWMTWDELREAIPPAYTEFIGRQLIRAATERAA